MTEDKSGGDQLGKPSNLPMYLGPYEVWNFGAGRDYALPLMRKYWRYISALAELGVGISTGDAIQQLEQRGGWIPTLWLAPHELTFIPFIVENPFDTTMPTVEQLNRFLLTGFGIAVDRYFHPAAALELSEPSVPAGAFAEQIMRSRFRIAFPVADDAMHLVLGEDHRERRLHRLRCGQEDQRPQASHRHRYRGPSGKRKCCLCNSYQVAPRCKRDDNY